jgi:membrane protein implicated in regulation of membrane protease activity
MKQLPGRARPKWLLALGQGIAVVVFVAMTASILPVLLIASLVAALLLIPVMQQLRKEVERTAVTLNTPSREQMVDITPLHQRLRQEFLLFMRRRN